MVFIVLCVGSESVSMILLVLVEGIGCWVKLCYLVCVSSIMWMVLFYIMYVVVLLVKCGLFVKLMV